MKLVTFASYFGKAGRLYINESGDLIWEHETNDCLCLPLGKGCMNSFELLATLRAEDYREFLSIEPHEKAEVHTDTINRTVDCIRSLERLRSLDEQNWH